VRARRFDVEGMNIMIRTRTIWLGLGLLAATAWQATGCGGESSGSGNSNTNWLYCDTNGECVPKFGSNFLCVNHVCSAESAGTVRDGGPDSSVSSGLSAGTPVTPDEKCGDAPRTLVDRMHLATPDAVFSGESAGMHVAVNATDLYYTLDGDGAIVKGVATGGLVARVSLKGGAPVVAASIVGYAVDIVLTDTTLILAESHPADSTGLILRIPLGGGDRVVLAPTLNLRPGIATDGRNVYFADDQGTKSVPVAGGDVRTLSTETGQLALFGSGLVVASTGQLSDTASTIYDIPIAGGPPTVLATGEFDAGTPVACGADVCWGLSMTGDAAPSCCFGTGAIRRLKPGGVPETVVADEGLFPIFQLVYDGANFFATIIADASAGEAVRVPGDGGSVAYLGSGASIAVDDRCVYLAGLDSGVWSVVKTYTQP
jgi:hypothetical protein